MDSQENRLESVEVQRLEVVKTQILLCLEESVFYTTGGEMLRKKTALSKRLGWSFHCKSTSLNMSQKDTEFRRMKYHTADLSAAIL